MQIIANLDVGGAQEVVRTLSQGFIERGYPTVVVSFKDGPFREEIESQGIPVEILPQRQHSILNFPSYMLEIIQIRQKLIQLVKKYQVDIVQTHLLRSLDFLVATLRLRSARPLVFWTVHNVNFALRPDQLPSFRWLAGAKQLAHNWLYRTMSRRVNGFIAVSSEVGSAVQKIIKPAEHQVILIRNGVDVRRYQTALNRSFVRQSLGFEEKDLLFTVVGTLKEQKGHRYLIDAVASLKNDFPNLQILLVGDGELRKKLEAQVNQAELAQKIHFLGNRSDVPAILSASDAFILPSLWEGLPMALVEAMASGLPVVATEVSGSQEVVLPGETGLLVLPADSAQLRQAITEIITKPGKAQAMGLAGRKRIETLFGAGKQVDEHLALYHREWGIAVE